MPLDVINDLYNYFSFFFKTIAMGYIVIVFVASEIQQKIGEYPHVLWIIILLYRKIDNHEFDKIIPQTTITSVCVCTYNTAEFFSSENVQHKNTMDISPVK